MYKIVVEKRSSLTNFCAKIQTFSTNNQNLSFSVFSFSVFQDFLQFEFLDKNVVLELCGLALQRGYQRAFCIKGSRQESKTIFQRPFSQLFGVAASADLLSSQLVVKLKHSALSNACSTQRYWVRERLELQSSFNWGSVH